MQKKKNITRTKKGLFTLKTLIVCIYFFICFLLTVPTGFAVVNGQSMEPTLTENDFLFMRKYGEVHRNDIICVNSNELDTFIIKRVIGVSGDKIEISNEGLLVNNNLLEESYISSNNWCKTPLNVTVPDDCFFIIGDNRDYSTDSRTIGFVSENDIKGVMIVNMTDEFNIHSNVFYIGMAVLCAIMYVLCAVDAKRRKRDD